MAGHLIAQVVAACTDLRTYTGSQRQPEIQLVISSLLKHSDSLTVLDLDNSSIMWTESG